MKKFQIDIIVGARPNFMKVAALFNVASEFPQCDLRLIHTGQHYDECMSAIFLEEFGLPIPTACFEVGSASRTVQIAKITKKYEVYVNQNPPDMCIVVGDVNSTVACSEVATKHKIPLAHVEAGLRSFDQAMPEEVNRILTDRLSNLHFVTEPSGIKNLNNEGINQNGVHLVGNVMIDVLIKMQPKAHSLQNYKKFSVKPKGYAYLTLHRPSNVDDPQSLLALCKQIIWTAQKIPIIFPVHPRTKKYLNEFKLKQSLEANANIHMSEPFGYLESLSLLMNAKVVITDSGGMQEESTFLNIPCLTLRDNTERPITVEQGTNTLIKQNWTLFQKCIGDILQEKHKSGNKNIKYWDGKTGLKILTICQDYLQTN